MNTNIKGRVAILYPGDQEIRKNATPDNNRLAPMFRALADVGLQAEPVVYHDDFSEEVRPQLMAADAVLVWMNPIQDGHDRSILDPMLREVAAAGIFVSTHPDIILKLGTKEVVYRTRSIGWGCDTHLYRSFDDLRRELPARLATGEARVLKQYRGNGGRGVWKVELAEEAPAPQAETPVRVRQAKKGSVEETMAMGAFFERCEPYFAGEGRMIDQAFQERLPDGMVRCYMVHDKVVGFGHQAINAFFPALPGEPPSTAPQPGPHLHHPPTKPEFQALKNKVETKWVHDMQQVLGIDTHLLPILWDCDFLFGPRDASGNDTFVLCEINVSSIAPFPESAPPFVAEATLARIEAAGQRLA